MACPFKNGEVPNSIQKMFTEFIKPGILSHEFCSILTKQELENVRTAVRRSGDIIGAHRLLDILTTKENWFNSLLEILCKPDVKLQHIAAMMKEEMRIFKDAQSSQHQGHNWRTRASASCNYIEYNNAMEANIRELFKFYIEPVNVIYAFSKYSNNKVLTTIDIQNVLAEMRNHGENAGALLLLERLVLYEDWFNVLLEVLRDPEINLNHVAKAMEQATYSTRQQCDQQCIDNLSANNRKTITDTADGMHIEDMANANEEYESDGPEMKCRPEAQMQDHGNADDKMSESSRNLPLQTAVSVDGNSGKTELMAAASAGDGEHLMALINATRDINESDNKGRTALMYAAVKGRTECLKLLIACECDLNKQDHNGNTALMTACGEGHTECVNYLISGRADGNVANKSGATALMVASKKGYVDCLKLLLENGCDPDKPHHDGLTAVMYAARHGKLECLKLLIERRCDINMATIKGQTALMFAAGNGHSYCVKILIDSHCNVNMCDSKGQTALMFAANNGHITCIEMLIDGGADIDKTDFNRNSAVMFALQGQRTECVKFLINKKANLKIPNRSGNTALKFAKKQGYMLN